VQIPFIYNRMEIIALDAQGKDQQGIEHMQECIFAFGYRGSYYSLMIVWIDTKGWLAYLVSQCM